jgi:3-mercaptopyruvate sulfurtransferase SseA
MRLLLSLSAAVVLAIVTLAACNSSDTNGNRAGSSSNAGSRGNSAASVPSATPGHVAPSDGIKRVTTVELRDALAKGTAIVVDVRAPSVYQQNHIKDSISIPLEQTAARLQELPRDKMIVTYCS